MKKVFSTALPVFFIILALIVSLMPAVPAKAAGVSDPDRAAVIRSLLSVGDCVDGSALAVVRGTDDFDFPAETERLSNADADTVSSALEKYAAGGYPVFAESADRFRADEEYALYRVLDPSRSTKELLEKLCADERVLFAEPDYRVSAPASFLTESPDSSAISGPEKKPAASSKKSLYEDTSGDLTPYQWYLTDKEENGYSTPEAPEGTHYTLNVPGWNEEEENSSGTIAIMDTGIDTSHPDLQDVLFKFSVEQQNRFGCGPYGKNVNDRQLGEEDSPDDLIPEEEYQRDITDHMMHGTHIAGIIAGLWDDKGISGIANGAKIFGVRVYADDGMSQSSSDIVRGFEWLTTVAKEVNLKAVNVSLGTLKPQLVHTIMVNKLGELGVNTVYASGNMAMDLDEEIDLGGENNSIYAITVNAANPNGKKTQFSCYGQTSTDVFAPGAQILSSTPSIIETADLAGEVKDLHPYVRFFPENTDESHLASGKVETFETDDPSVLFFDTCPVKEDGSSNDKAKEVGVRNKEYGFDDTSSYEIDFASLPENESENRIHMYSLYPLYKGVWMAIPAEDEENIKWAGGKGAFNDETHVYCGVASVLCAKKNKDGSVTPENIDMRFDDILKIPSLEGAPAGGYASVATMNYSSAQWGEWALDLEGFVEGAAWFHTLDEDAREDAGFDLYDPGELTGPYLWEHDGQKYVLLQLGIALQEGGTVLEKETRLLIDDVALGDDQAAAGAYTYLCGTSMAAPCVTASLAVIAADEPESKDLSDEELKNEALERAAKLLASVDYDDDLAPYCRTGGRVNLNGQTEFTKKAPLIERAEMNGSTLTITGYFFGEKGELYIDDEKAAVEKWSDTKITASVSGLSNDSHIAKVINTDKAVSRVLFSYSKNRNGVSPDEDDQKGIAPAEGDEKDQKDAAPDEEDSEEDTQLYEEDLSLPLDDPAFLAEYTDGFAGSFAFDDGSFYVLSCDSTEISQGMWRYDTSAGEWSHCAALPEELSGMSVEKNSLAAADGMIYLYMYRKGLNEGTPQLWSYDPDKDSWSEIEVKDLCPSAGLISFDGKLLFIRGDINSDETDEEEPAGNFCFIDTDAGKLLPAKGSLDEDITSFTDVTFSASSEKLYAFSSRYVDDVTEELVLIRYTYDAKTNKFKEEDVSDAIQGIAKKKQDLAFAGIPDGIAVISPKEPGKDTYVLKDSAEAFHSLGRTSCYHKASFPVAGSDGEKLYVLALNSTEPDVLYFRAAAL